MSLLARVRDEDRGSVLLIVAGFLPVAIFLAAFVIDVGNAMEHRRQLQLQADAGALAAAQEFHGCQSNDATVVAATNADIRRVAEHYALVENEFIGGEDGQERLTPVINEDPCGDGFVDVKIIESDSPNFFDLLKHDYSARAKVQIFEADQLEGLLPIAVPVPDPKNAAAIFFDEETGEVLQTAALDRVEAQDEQGLAMWETSGAADVPIDAEHVGVGIALSGGSSTACDDALVVCFGNDTGLAHIRGWSSAGTVSQNATIGLQSKPIVRSVSLEPTTPACDDIRFLPSFSGASPDCEAAKRTVAISAVVDFGGNPADVGATVTPVVNGTTGSPLVFDTTAPWTARGVLSIPAGSGPLEIALDWEATKGEIPGNGNKVDECKTGGGNKCRGTFPDERDGFLQRHMRADESSGPIELVQVSEANGVAHANSFESCASAPASCEHKLSVKIGISGTLKADNSASAELVHLRMLGGNQTQALSCSIPDAETDEGENLKTELQIGCPWYAVNKGTACPGDLAGLQLLPQPWECVGVLPGDHMNQVAEGLNARILGDRKADECTHPNNWPNYNPDTDPRVALVFLTRFGAFDSTGRNTVPITGFATFYVTGWNSQGGGFENPCQTDGTDDPASAEGEIVGHYIGPHVVIPQDGNGINECPFGSSNPTPCIPLLVD